MGRRAMLLAAVGAVAAGVAVAVLGLEVVAPVLVAGGVFGAALVLRRAHQLMGRAGRQVEKMARAQTAQGKSLDRITTQVGKLAKADDLRRVRESLRDRTTRDFRQLEALLNLHAIAPVRFAIPPTRQWAASPDLLLLLTSLIATGRPSTVIDIGSGNSTLWMSLAMRAYGVQGRVIALEHQDSYAKSSQDLIALHGLTDIAEVRHAPLIDVKLAQEVWPWYDLGVLDDVTSCDLLVVDGPPALTRPHARYPALPMLADRLSPNAVIVLDDCVRADEKEIVARWLAEFDGWAAQEYPHEKITTVLRRQR